ncbi:MAG: SHOCT domain-containing protein [Chloroflexota bacterium]
MFNDHRPLMVVLVILLVFVALGPVMMGTMMGPGVTMGPGMMWGPNTPGITPNMPGWMWGTGMAFGWLAMLAFWGVLIVGLVLLVRWAAGAPSHLAHPAAESPQEILKRRYAHGEIDQATFERMRREIE